MFVDTHCHLNDDKFEDIDSVYRAMIDSEVDFAINMGCDTESSLCGQSLAEKFSKIYFGAGFHPSEAERFSTISLDTIKKIANHPKCVAIGEVGLDYHYEGYDKKAQLNAFVSQLELANELKLPVSVHSRDATSDMIETLKANKNLLLNGCVMHCFSGSKETAEILLDLGLYISFSGTLTFKNAKNLHETAKFVPLERCLTETDSPYLAPEPYRGKRNEPAYVGNVAIKLAEIKNMEKSAVFEILKDNAHRVFGKIKK